MSSFGRYQCSSNNYLFKKLVRGGRSDSNFWPKISPKIRFSLAPKEGYPMGPWAFEGPKSIKNRALIRHTTFKKRYLHEITRRQTERNLFPSSISRGPGADVAVGTLIYINLPKIFQRLLKIVPPKEGYPMGPWAFEGPKSIKNR